MTSQSQIDQQVRGLRFQGGKWDSFSDEALTAHVAAWFAAFDQTGIVLPIGPTANMTAEEMLVAARTKAAEKAAVSAKINRRYAGARALRAKYGDESAERIIAKHRKG